MSTYATQSNDRGTRRRIGQPVGSSKRRVDRPQTDESDSLFDRARGGSADTTTNDSGSWFDRAKAKYGLGTLLVAAGAVLFLFPEQITSTAGLVLIGAGFLVWLLG